ncbi:hypothetical protein ABZP36_020473 [Zizania latifolia]
MSTVYMSQLSAALPLMEGDHHHHHHRHQDHHQGHFQAFSLPKDPPILFPFVISSSSSNPSDTTLSYGSDHHLRQQQHQALLEPQHMIGGSSSAGIFATPFPTVESIRDRDDMIERSPFDPYDTEKQLHGSCGSANKVAGSKWSAAPAAKMRITRKTSDVVPSGVAGGVAAAKVKKPRRRAQVYEDHGHGAGAVGAMGQGLGVIRVCSDCNTTKTPLWRSGPCGPKSLCNACGIRQRKAQRAMMASGSPASTVAGAKAAATPTDAAAAQPKVKKEKRADVDRTLPFKKRCKVVQVQDQTVPPATNAAAMEEIAESAAAPPTRGPLVDSICLSWTTKIPSVAATTSSCSFRPSPAAAAVQDEITDAAMLLMTLSCGLVRS